MKENEMKELDAWIAENVMGFSWIDIPSEGGSEFDAAASVLVIKQPNDGFETTPRPSFNKSFHLVPHYTTDKAAAFDVLERCADKCQLSITSVVRIEMERSISEWMASCEGRPKTIYTTAETLPLAICLFARQLFAKEGV